MHILTKGPQVIQVNNDQTANLSCEFYAQDFNLFENPIIWRKTQLGEDFQMNMMGNLIEPFSTVRRFKVTLDQHSPRYLFTLAITSKLTFIITGKLNIANQKKLTLAFKSK